MIDSILSEKLSLSFQAVIQRVNTAACIASPGTGEVLFSNTLFDNLCGKGAHFENIALPENPGRMLVESATEECRSCCFLIRGSSGKNFEFIGDMVVIPGTEYAAFFLDQGEKTGGGDDDNIDLKIIELENRLHERTRELRKGILERRDTERKLHLSRSIFDSVIANASVGILVSDETGTITEVNNRFCQLVGHNREDLLGTGYPRPFWPRDMVVELSAVAQRGINGESFDQDSEFVAKDGSRVPVGLTLSPIRGQSGRSRGYVCMVQDISMRNEALSQLRFRNAQYRELVESARSIILKLDTAGRITFMNDYALEFFGFKAEEVVGKDMLETIVPEKDSYGTKMINLIDRLTSTVTDSFENQNENVRKDGSRCWVSWSNRLIRNDEGDILEILCVGTDITERKRIEEELRTANERMEDRVRERTKELAEANAKLKAQIGQVNEARWELMLMGKVFESSLEGISITDATGRIIKVNKAFTDITGYAPDEVIGLNPSVLKSDQHNREFYENMWKSLRATGIWEGEIRNRRKNGEVYPEWLSISSIKDEQGETTHYVAVFHDLTEMRRTEERMRHQSNHDALTGLPNRWVLQDRLSVAINHARHSREKLAIMMLDMDNFKTVNDSLGHSMGDEMLKQVARRLREIVPSGTISRPSGDEFVIVLEAIKSESELMSVVESVFGLFEAPFWIGNNEVYATTSLGVTVFPDDGGEAETLMKNAEMAMYRAKEDGKNTYQIFAPSMNERVTKRLNVERQLRKALDNSDIEPFYQGIIDVRTGRIVSMEALARWIKPDGTFISPADFIPVAEEAGLIDRLGHMILEKACLQTNKWRQTISPDLNVSVNLSVKQLEKQDCFENISQVLTDCGLDPAALTLEITETAIMRNVHRGKELMQDFASMGIGISIDDFGTGYSSLYYLKQFPISTLKIDKSFISDLPGNTDDVSIVSAIISMANSLRIGVIAEGVETAEQLQLLRFQGCRRMQGYLVFKPMPADAFTRVLESYVPDRQLFPASRKEAV